MSKKILCGFMAALMALAPAFAYAEDGEQGSAGYSFRSIPWLTAKSEVESILESEGAVEEDVESPFIHNSIITMYGIDYLDIVSGKEFVDDGGVIECYSGLDVAGYEPSTTHAAYMYPINEDGTVNKDEEDAQFYFAWYTFNPEDFEDEEGLYNDLKEQLTSLYGEGEEDLYNYNPDYFSNITWTDEQGNEIRLQLGAKGEDKAYVTIGYIVANGESMVYDVSNAIYTQNIKAVQEALNELGYDCGTPDGVNGDATREAIESYQSDHDMYVSGVVTSDLLEELGLKESP